MASNFKNRVTVLLNSTAMSRPLFLLGTMSALVAGSTGAQAFDANSLPQGGTVTGGSATVATSGNTLTVNQSSNRAIIDWRSFDIGSNAQANFNQPGASSIAVNRVNGATDPSRIEGGLHANGQVWILNPNGVLFGKTARVDASGVVATTANIDDRAFMAGSNKLQMTGGDSGRVENAGQISVGEGGLAAFVAPSVRNSGTIRARVGKVTLAAGDTYTLDLAGDRLVELGLGSAHAVVDQSGKIVNAGGVIEISAKAAGQVVDSVINVSGVTSASSVKNAGGQIILGGDDINVASSASLSADGTSGGQITAVADKTGNYAGSYSAQASNGDGGSIETSGKTVHIDSNIAVNTSAPKGKTGNWTLDPDDLTVGSSGAGSIDGGTGVNSEDDTIDAATVVTALNTTDVTLQARNSITVNSAIDASGNANAHSLTLADQDANGALEIDLNAAIILKSGGALSGDGTLVNVGATGLIQNGIDAAAGGATVNLANGATYREQVVIAKDVTLNGDNATIESPDVLSRSFTYDSMARNAVVMVENATNANISDLTIDGRGQGNANGAFLGLGMYNSSGTIDNVTITRVRSGGEAGTLSGAQHTYAFGAFNDAGSHTVTLENSHLNDFEKDGAAFYGHDLTANVTDNTVTGAGPTAVTAQNGIVLIGASGTVSGNHVSGISYTPDTVWATNIYLDDAGSTVVSGNIVTGAGGPNGSSLGLYVRNSAADVNNNTFQNLEGGIEADTDTTGLSITDNTFTNNLLHFIGDADQTAAVLAVNDFDRSVVNDAAGDTIYGDLQYAIESEGAGSTLDVGAGTYTGSILLDQADVTLHSTVLGGAVIDANGAAEGIEVSTTSGPLGVLTVDGFTVNNWTSGGIIQSMAAGSLASMRITNNIVNGPPAGASSHGNGIQVSGDGSVVSGNKVYAVHLNSPDWSGSDIIVVNGSDITVDNNLVDGDDTGIAVTNWNNTAGMSNIKITDNQVTGVAEGISIQTYEGEIVPIASGPISGVVITGNQLRGNENGLGVWDYSTAGIASWSSTFSDISGNTFTNNDYQVESDFTGFNVKSLLASNHFDRAVVNDVGGRDSFGDENIYSSLQTAIDTEVAGSTLDVGAGTYNESIVLDKANTTLHSIVQGGAIINAGGAAEGIEVSTTSGNLGVLTVDGFTVNNWTSGGIIQSMAAGSLASMRITNNIVNGPPAGATSHGNGIEVTGDGSVVSGNSVYAVHLNSPDWSGSDIIVANGSHILVDNNLVDGDDTGIAVTNWNNTAGMSDIKVTNNHVSHVSEGISIQTYEGEIVPIASGPISGVVITGNDVHDNDNGLGLWDYSTAGNASWSSTFSNISGNIFTNNDYQVESDFTGTNVKSLLATNSFDRSVVNDAGGRDSFDDENIYGGLQIAVNNEAAGSTLDVGAGTYAEAVSVGTQFSFNFAGADVDDLEITAGGAGSTLAGNLKAGGVTALGGIVLGGDLSIDTTEDNGAIVLAAVDGAHALTLNAGTGTVSLGNAGAATRLGALSVTGATTLTGGTYKAASVNLGNTVLSADTSIDTANGALTVAAVDGTHALTLTSGTGTVTLGNVGATTRLGALNAAGGATLTGATYRAASVNLGNTILGADASIDTSASNGALTVAAVNGAHALTLKSGTGALSLGNAGATTRLGALNVTGPTTLTGSTYKAASASFGGKVTLTAANTVVDTTVSSAAAGNITFAGDIFGVTDGAQSLTLSAGSGTGAKSANADISLQNAGTGAVRLGSMTVSGDDFSALTVDLAGNFTSTLTGNQVFAADTLNAGGNVTSDVGGNASGHIVSGGAVDLSADGNISGTITSTGNVLLTAGNNITSNVSGGSVVTLTAGNNITGSISGQTVTLTGDVVIATVDAQTLNLFAGSGDVGGSFAYGLVSNQQRINGQQLVVENFPLPAGTQIGANGALILPAGTVIGLLSPGGGPARVIMVTDVQTLGQLLSEGYTAIVIDLKAKKHAPVQVASN